MTTWTLLGGAGLRDHTVADLAWSAIDRRLGVGVELEIREFKHQRALGEFLGSWVSNSAARGCSIALPWKKVARDLLAPISSDPVSPTLRPSDLINSVWKDAQTDDVVVANTDGFAVRTSLPIGIAGKNALVLGLGGAGRAVAAALVDAGLRVWGYDLSHYSLPSVRSFSSLGELRRGRFSVLVNATPIGKMNRRVPCELFALPLHPDDVVRMMEPGSVVVDLNYLPAMSPLAAVARLAGVRVVTGVEVLLRQALRAAECAFELGDTSSADLDALVAEVTASVESVEDYVYGLRSAR